MNGSVESGILARLNNASSAEDFFALLGVDYDPTFGFGNASSTNPSFSLGPMVGLIRVFRNTPIFLEVYVEPYEYIMTRSTADGVTTHAVSHSFVADGGVGMGYIF